MYQIKSLAYRLERSTKPRSQLLGSPAAAQALFISLKQTGLGLQPNSVRPLPFQRDGESLPAELTALLPPQPGAILRPSPKANAAPSLALLISVPSPHLQWNLQACGFRGVPESSPTQSDFVAFSSFLMLNKSATCAESFEPARSPVNLHQKSGSQVQSCLGRLKDKAL